MKTLRNYPGVLTILLVAMAMAINGLVDYIDYQPAAPSFLAALGCLTSALIVVGVYEFKALKASKKTVKLSNKH